MFGFGGRTLHRQLVRNELGESLDHLARAATHVASGVGAAVGPRAYAARDYLSPAATRVRRTASAGWESAVTRLAPLAVAAAEGARQAGSVARKARSKRVKTMRKKKSMMRRRWPMLTGLLVAGAVAGAAGAVAMRRRNQHPWEEYDPAATLDAVRGDAAAIVGDSTGGSRETTAPKSPPMEKTVDRGASAGERAAHGTAVTGGAQKAARGGQKADGLLGTAAAPAGGS